MLGRKKICSKHRLYVLTFFMGVAYIWFATIITKISNITIRAEEQDK